MLDEASNDAFFLAPLDQQDLAQRSFKTIRIPKVASISSNKAVKDTASWPWVDLELWLLKEHLLPMDTPVTLHASINDTGDISELKLAYKLNSNNADTSQLIEAYHHKLDALAKIPDALSTSVNNIKLRCKASDADDYWRPKIFEVATMEAKTNTTPTAVKRRKSLTEYCEAHHCLNSPLKRQLSLKTEDNANFTEDESDEEFQTQKTVIDPTIWYDETDKLGNAANNPHYEDTASHSEDESDGESPIETTDTDPTIWYDEMHKSGNAAKNPQNQVIRQMVAPVAKTSQNSEKTIGIPPNTCRDMAILIFDVGGMHCADCTNSVEKQAAKAPHVIKALAYQNQLQVTCLLQHTEIVKQFMLKKIDGYPIHLNTPPESLRLRIQNLQSDQINKLTTHLATIEKGINVQSITWQNTPVNEVVITCKFDNPFGLDKPSIIHNLSEDLGKKFKDIQLTSDEPSVPPVASRSFFYSILAVLICWQLPLYWPWLNQNQYMLAGFSFISLLCTGQPIWRKAWPTFWRLIPGLCLNIIGVILLTSVNTPVWLAGSTIGLGVTLNMMVSWRIKANMYTAQMLSISITWFGMLADLFWPNMGFPMPMWHHPLMMLTILLFAQAFKTWLAPKAIPPISQAQKRWHMPCRVQCDDDEQSFVNVSKLKKDNKFTLPEGQHYLPIDAVNTTNIEIPKSFFNGQDESCFLTIPAHTAIKSGTPINLTKPTTFIVSASRHQLVPQRIPYTHWTHWLSKHFTSLLLTIATVTSVLQFYTTANILSTFCAILVVACPCAFCVADPIIEAMARKQLQAHVFINQKKGTVIDLLTFFHHATHVVFDVTGTLTYPKQKLVNNSANHLTLRENAAEVFEVLTKNKHGFVLTGNDNADDRSQIQSKLALKAKIHYAEDKRQWAIDNLAADQHDMMQRIKQTLRRILHQLFGWSRATPSYPPHIKPTVSVGDGTNCAAMWAQHPNICGVCLPHSWDTVQQQAAFVLVNQTTPLSGLLTLKKTASWVYHWRQIAYITASTYTILAVSACLTGLITNPMSACLWLCFSNILIVLLASIYCWRYNPGSQQSTAITTLNSNCPTVSSAVEATQEAPPAKPNIITTTPRKRICCGV